MTNSPLWNPDNSERKAANLSKFIEFCSKEFGYSGENFTDFYNWSVKTKEQFWAAVVQFTDVRWASPSRMVFQPAEEFIASQWFDDGQLSFAENLLRFDDERTAVISVKESGDIKKLSYHELRSEVSKVQEFLRAHAVQPGDRVAGFVPNSQHAIVCMLATSGLGAVWSSCSPDFGFKGVIDRFGQIEPKVLVGCDGYHFKGKTIVTEDKLAELQQALPSVEALLVIPFLDNSPTTSIPGATPWAALVAGALEFKPMPFNHPLYVMYSSGTTGAPKCIVHGAGGTLVQHLKELVLHTDLTREDTLFYFTTCGWMMWNWFVSALAVGATVVTYDGNPLFPKADRLFQLVEDLGVTVFGTSAKFLSAVENSDIFSSNDLKLESLRAILSTGSPLMPEQYDWVYNSVKPDVQLASISGGTDIISCFCLGNPLTPVYRGEIQSRGLGMDVVVFDENGKEVLDTPGELVCKSSFPSKPIYFWNDADGEKYRRAYFNRFPNIWCHGDWAELKQNGGMVIYGRSDATLNPGGVRIGTAEIYSVVEQFQEVTESLVVGKRSGGDEQLVLFVVLKEGAVLTTDLKQALAAQLRSQASPRHVPKYIFAVGEIPRTISGKIVELSVRKILEGEAVKNRDALANPDSLKAFEKIAAELQENA